MGMSNIEFNTSGLDDFKREINDTIEKIESLDGAQVDFDESFTIEFMQNHAGVSSFDAFLKRGNFKVEKQEDFEAIPDDVFDNYVKENTDFSSWEEMFDAATDEYLDSQLDF